ncbi:MAG: response regulator [Phaeodactylibacter sp.]|nr:response regulator [Phaeodactylibacter sp.]MCB9051518.1 response regulator [Lewinellaceae bacterium]
MQTEDRELLGKALNSVGNCFHSLAQNDSAIVYLVQSAKVKEQLGNQKDVASAYANIGNVFSDTKAHDKAIEYLERALAIRLSLPEGEKSAIVTYNNLSVAYSGKGDQDMAIEYAQKGLELARQTGNNFFAGVLAGSLSHMWLKKNELNKAVEMSEQSIALLSEVNRRSNLVYPYANLSEALWRKGSFQRALEANQLGYAIMEELKLVEPLEAYYENFAHIYESMGDHRQALAWYKKFMVLDDSLFNKEKLEAIAEVEAKYETEKKEALLARQQLQIERDATQKRTFLLLAFFALLSLTGLLLYWRNRQNLKQREAELKAQLEHAEAEKLREMDALKSMFFANISHEFRTPLTLILSPVEQLMEGAFQGAHQKYFRIIHRNGKRLLTLVNQLLELSKLESGKLSLKAAEGDLSRFIAAVAWSFESLAIRQQVGLHANFPERPLMGYFDQDKVEKILVNLMSNAFKFTGEGGAVAVTLEAANGTARIVVSDTGIGIPAEQLPFLFDRFYQARVQVTPSPAHGDKERVEGAGIGLALARELAVLHGGGISVESKEGKGTIFTVTLTISKDFFKEEEIVSAPAPPLATSGHEVTPAPAAPLLQHSGFHIAPHTSGMPLVLLAEDNPELRSYISDTLEGHCQVIEVENGKLAFDKALQTTPDLVITDLMMPVMDGMELCRRLKTEEKTSHIPVIILTARAEQDDKLEGLETGADDYLVKPFDARELRARISNLILQRRKLQEYYRQALHVLAPSEVQPDSMDAIFLQNVREAIENNLDDENFSVVELSSKMNMSRSQLYRKLSALTGFSPNEAIRNMRLERARQLLQRKAGTVSEVAFLCGFNSPAYFIKCFKDYFGITPGDA